MTAVFMKLLNLSIHAGWLILAVVLVRFFLKKLESKGYITRTREASDERCLSVSLTDEGEKLQHKAASVPKSMASCVNLSEDEAKSLYCTLYKILESLRKDA